MWPGYFPKECNQDVNRDPEELADRVVTSFELWGVEELSLGLVHWPNQGNKLVGLCFGPVVWTAAYLCTACVWEMTSRARIWIPLALLPTSLSAPNQADLYHCMGSRLGTSGRNLQGIKELLMNFIGKLPGGSCSLMAGAGKLCPNQPWVHFPMPPEINAVWHYSCWGGGGGIRYTQWPFSLLWVASFPNLPGTLGDTALVWNFHSHVLLEMSVNKTTAHLFTPRLSTCIVSGLKAHLYSRNFGTIQNFNMCSIVL